MREENPMIEKRTKSFNETTFGLIFFQSPAQQAQAVVAPYGISFQAARFCIGTSSRRGTAKVGTLPPQK